MFGDFGNDFTFLLSSIILTKFYTDVMGVSAGVVGTLMMVVCYLLTYNMITEHVPYVADENKQKQPGIGTMLKNAVKNRALISIIVASIMMLLAQLTMQNMNAYIYPDYYGNSSAMSIAGIGSAIGMMLTAIGYNESASSMGIEQTDSVKTGMLAITTLIPAAGFILLGIVLLFWYPLHKKQVAEAMHEYIQNNLDDLSRSLRVFCDFYPFRIKSDIAVWQCPILLFFMDFMKQR